MRIITCREEDEELSDDVGLETAASSFGMIFWLEVVELEEDELPLGEEEGQEEGQEEGLSLGEELEEPVVPVL